MARFATGTLVNGDKRIRQKIHFIESVSQKAFSRDSLRLPFITTISAILHDPISLEYANF
jgi:hypothetical protein